MPVVRQLGEIQFPTTTATVGSDLLSRRLSRGLPRCGGRRRLQIEQVPLAPSFDGPLTPPPVDPPLQAVELVQRGLVRCFQLFIGGRCGVEHMLQLGRLLESCQQQTLALGEIVGEWKGVVHNAPCCNNSIDFGKTILQKSQPT